MLISDWFPATRSHCNTAQREGVSYIEVCLGLNMAHNIAVSERSAWLFDGDGVLYKQSNLLPGAVELINYLQSSGRKVALITNNTTKTTKQYVQKLAEMGLEIPESSIITAAYVTVDRLAPVDSAFVLGADGILDACMQKRIRVVDGFKSDDVPDVVLVGMDIHLTYERLANAALCIQAGGRFIGTNPDKSFPGENGILPGAGAVIAAVAATVGKDPEMIVGKPSPYMFEAALSVLGAEPSQAIMIGDRFETDIVGAHNAGIPSVLVRTGIGAGYSIEELDRIALDERGPYLIADSLVDLLELLKQTDSKS